MSIKAVLFDLDGTLLPMDQNVFAGKYFSELMRKFVPLGYDKDKLADAVWSGIGAMVQNDGSVTNSDAFWHAFKGSYGDRVDTDRPIFDEFYAVDFDNVQESCGFDAAAGETVRKIKEKGLRVAIATNPIFPSVATKKRIGWAGVDEALLDGFTAFEDSHYCKPNPAYYSEFLGKLGLSPAECLMVGNDVSEDMIAEELGMKVFLLTRDLINKKEKDISPYRQGGFDDLMAYVDELACG